MIAVDPIAMKRTAALQLGATDAVASMDEAASIVRSATNGQGADSTIVSVGILAGEHVGQAFDAIRKGGTVVVTAVAPAAVEAIPISPAVMAMFQKRIQGCLYGMMSPSSDTLRLLALYEQGQLELDSLVTRTYTLEQINAGYSDMHKGLNIRGVVEFE